MLTGSAVSMPSSSETLTPGLVRLMAAGAGLCVASNYFAQPLLPLFAQTFGIGSTQAAFLVTVTQLGYIAGLPLSADLAPPMRRGRVVSSVMSGLLIGILLARFAAGLIAHVAGWRAVYLVAAVLMAFFCWTCQRRLPRVAPRTQGGYGALLKSIVHLFATEPVLRRRGLVGGLCFGAFAAFWTSMAFMLKERWHASDAAIGAVALVGAIGAMSARFAGRLADQGWARVSTGVFLLLIVASWALLLAGTHSIAALIGA